MECMPLVASKMACRTPLVGNLGKALTADYANLFGVKAATSKLVSADQMFAIYPHARPLETSDAGPQPLLTVQDVLAEMHSAETLLEGGRVAHSKLQT